MQGYAYDERCDLWSLGITAIELAEGRTPFHDLDPAKAMQEVLRQKPPVLKHSEVWSGRFQDFLKEVRVRGGAAQMY